MYSIVLCHRSLCTQTYIVYIKYTHIVKFSIFNTVRSFWQGNFKSSLQGGKVWAHLVYRFLRDISSSSINLNFLLSRQSVQKNGQLNLNKGTDHNCRSIFNWESFSPYGSSLPTCRPTVVSMVIPLSKISHLHLWDRMWYTFLIK